MTGGRIVVIGGGEHARVVIETIRASADPWELAGFVDPEPCVETSTRLGIPRLGTDEVLAAHPGLYAILGFGSFEARARRQDAVRRLTPMVRGWATVVHATAWVSPSASIGEGTVIVAGAIVQTGARVGAHCVLNTGAIVEHDVILEEHVLVAPRATLGGGARVGAGAYIGLGASLRDHTSVGAGALVGMGAVVVRDVAPATRVMGVPAR